MYGLQKGNLFRSVNRAFFSQMVFKYIADNVRQTLSVIHCWFVLSKLIGSVMIISARNLSIATLVFV